MITDKKLKNGVLSPSKEYFTYIKTSPAICEDAEILPVYCTDGILQQGSLSCHAYHNTRSHLFILSCHLKEP